MNNFKQATVTQIRNLYCDGLSCLNIRFYNTNLSFQFYPFLSKDQNGRVTYDLKHGQMTTVNYEGAYALYKLSQDITDGKVQEASLSIPCAGNAYLILERKLSNNGEYETFFTLNKNNVSIPFRFATTKLQVKNNGQIQTITIESGLGVFLEVINGYLTGINADRHLDKLTEDYVNSKNEASAQQNPDGNTYNGNNQNNYRRNNNNGNYNNRGGNGNYGNNRRYNNGGNNNYNQNQNWNNNTNNGINHQPMSNYNLQN